jgi:hypothetical protein
LEVCHASLLSVTKIASGCVGGPRHEIDVVVQFQQTRRAPARFRPFSSRGSTCSQTVRKEVSSRNLHVVPIAGVARKSGNMRRNGCTSHGDQLVVSGIGPAMSDARRCRVNADETGWFTRWPGISAHDAVGTAPLRWLRRRSPTGAGGRLMSSRGRHSPLSRCSARCPTPQPPL